jgi:hypothetical protein
MASFQMISTARHRFVSNLVCSIDTGVISQMPRVFRKGKLSNYACLMHVTQAQRQTVTILSRRPQDPNEPLRRS